LDGVTLAYVTEGEGELESEVTPRKTIAPGSMFLTFPGVWHRYRALPGTRWSYYWIYFGGGYARHLVRERLISPESPVLSTGIQGALVEPFLRSFQRARTQTPGYQQLLAASTMEIIGIALALVTDRAQDHPVQDLVARARRFLETHVEAPVDLHALAASLGVGYHYFRELFKRRTGSAPYQYHLARRLERAKELLAETDLTIKDVAAFLHFDDAYHFSKTFKAKTGHCPSNWRLQQIRAGSHARP
jgi:AraC-like DNA-binding protein